LSERPATGTSAYSFGADIAAPSLLTPDAFVERLRSEGASRYHDQHPFHLAMHEGRLSRADLQRWVLNRYYYQTRIPIKDALILSKSEDPAFRRGWIRRIHDHDGAAEGEGGLAEWLRLAVAVGLDPGDVESCRLVHPGVRFACDTYVTLVRDSRLVVAVASSLTEFFAPDLMARRIEAWERHYPFVDSAGLAYFRARVPRARRDSEEAVAFVVAGAHTREVQDACVAALVRKTQILWHLLDCVAAGAGGGGP
jgi:pyrroloquinoline-quinone synthase